MYKTDINDLIERCRKAKEKKESKKKSHKESQRDYKSLEGWRRKYVRKSQKKHETELSREKKVLRKKKWREILKQREKEHRKQLRARKILRRRARKAMLKYVARQEKVAQQPKSIYTIRLMYDCIQREQLLDFTDRKEAYSAYNRKIKENRASVWCPVVKEERDDVMVNHRWTKHKEPDRVNKLGYEILLTKTDPTIISKNDNVRGFRNDFGRFEYSKMDNERMVILEKDQWLIEDTFHVSGHHPKYDRKTAPWIGENMILPGLTKMTPKRIFTFRNYIIIDSVLNFEFVKCRNKKECDRLYGVFFKKFEKTKWIYFTGGTQKETEWIWEGKILEKTGWRSVDWR